MIKDVSKLTEAEQQIERAQEAKRRAENCMVDIKNVLQRWNCLLDPAITITGQGIAPGYRIVPLDSISERS